MKRHFRRVVIFSDYTWCRLRQLGKELLERRETSTPFRPGFDSDDFDYREVIIDGFEPTDEEIEWHIKSMMDDEA